MPRKDDSEPAVPAVQEEPKIQVVSNEQLINMKIDRILELLEKK